MRKLATDERQIQEYIDFAFSHFQPPLKIRTSEWAERYRVLTSESSALPGQWRNSQTPHLVEIMDQADIREVREIVVMSSAQMGKSECANNIAGKKAHLEPGPIMIVQPTILSAQDYSKDRIAPMIKASPVLVDLFDDKKATMLHRPFVGGHLTLMGSNSPTQLASRPIKILLVDEEDRMKITSEGDPVAIAMKRTTTFRDSKIVHLSTPSIKGLSRIERHYLQSDMRKRMLPCPKCKSYQELVWTQVKWEKEGKRHLPKSAYYECSSCLHHWTEKERVLALPKGIWQKTNMEPVSGKVGFHISELYSTWRSLAQIVSDFLLAKDAPDLLQVFYNTTLGLSFEKVISGVSWKALKARAESYSLSVLPDRAYIVTAGVDVQADRLCVELVAWGADFETWSLGYFHILGDTGNERVWNELTEFFGTTQFHDGQTSRRVEKVAIDAGFNTQFVKRWVAKTPYAIAVVGRAKRNYIFTTPTLEEVRKDRKDKTGIRSYNVGVDKIKEELLNFLSQEIVNEDGESLIPYGYAHFSNSLPDSYYQEITSEHQVKKKQKGIDSFEWEVLPGRRNEALDCRVYARAAVYHLGYDRMGADQLAKYRFNKAVHAEKKEKKMALWSRKDV